MGISKHQLGFLQVALSGLCFGSLALLGKMAFTAGVSPGEFLALRFLGASAFLFLILMLTGQSVRLPWRDLGICALLGILGYALFSFLFFRALVDLSSALAVLLLYQYPWIVAVAGSLFLGEKVPRQQWLIFPFLLVGLGLVIGFDYSVQSPLGLLFGFGAAVFYAAYILIARAKLRLVPALTSTAWIQFFAGTVLLFLHFPGAFQFEIADSRRWERVHQVIEQAVLPLGLTILFPTVVAMSLFILGLQKLKAWEVSILSTLEPLTAILLGAFFLSERLSTTQILGCALLFAGLILLGWAQGRTTS